MAGVNRRDSTLSLHSASHSANSALSSVDTTAALASVGFVTKQLTTLDNSAFEARDASSPSTDRSAPRSAEFNGTTASCAIAEARNAGNLSASERNMTELQCTNSFAMEPRTTGEVCAASGTTVVNSVTARAS